MQSIHERRLKKRGELHGIRRTREDYVVDGVIAIVMVLVIIMTAYPFYYIIVMSLNEGLDATRGGIYFWPRKFTLNNYAKFLQDSSWQQAVLVSVAKTAIGGALTVFFTCLVAYGLSYRGLIGFRFYNIILLISMYFNSGLIPYYVVLRELGMLNTFSVYVIPTMFSIYYCFLARSFFTSIPSELYESASLDGASPLTIYLRIVLPLSKPLLATLFLFAAVGQWNSWSDTAYFAPINRDLRTLAYLLRDVIMRNQVPSGGSGAIAAQMAAQHSGTTAQSVQYAAMVIAVLPIIVVYPFLQKYFVSGIMTGAVKG